MALEATPDLVVTFANKFPVYFRSPFLLGLVWTLWGVNIAVFRAYGISYGELMGFEPSTMLSPRRIILSGLGLIALVGIITLGFVHHWPFSDALLFPSLLYITLAFLLVTPLDILHRPGRERLLHNLARVIFPAASGVLFVEVLLGDVLTSIAKVMADVEVTGCVLAAHLVTPLHGAHLPGQESDSYSSYEKECADSWMRPLVTSLPFMLRFRQCWVQYRVTGKAFPNLMNCVKYLSSLPVIWISAFTQQEGHFSRELRAAWIFAVSFNSFFSFMWDIVMDWGLCRQGARHFLLREHLVFASWGSPPANFVWQQPEEGAQDESAEDFEGRYSPLLYYVAIGLNFILRILWSFKLSVHFQLSQEGLTFVLEICEVFRRFVWILFRVEWEAIEKGLIPKHHHGHYPNLPRVATDLGALVVDTRETDMMKKKSPRPTRRADSAWGPVDTPDKKPEVSARERRISDRTGGTTT